MILYPPAEGPSRDLLVGSCVVWCNTVSDSSVERLASDEAAARHLQEHLQRSGWRFAEGERQ